MQKFLIFACLLILGSCTQLPEQDGVFSVSGNLSNHINERCILHVFDPSRTGFVRVANVYSVSGVFIREIYVSSDLIVHTIQVTCNNLIVVNRRVSYPGSIGYQGVVQLGLII